MRKTFTTEDTEDTEESAVEFKTRAVPTNMAKGRRPAISGPWFQGKSVSRLSSASSVSSVVKVVSPHFSQPLMLLERAPIGRRTNASSARDSDHMPDPTDLGRHGCATVQGGGGWAVQRVGVWFVGAA
jgi:hypothetical protein